ncbi:hypothetical protein V6N13_021252 [Hibiscus sabdariffa]
MFSWCSSCTQIPATHGHANRHRQPPATTHRSDMVTVEVQGVAGSREVTCPSDARSCSIVVVDEARIQRSQAFKNQWSRFDLNGDVA